MSKAGQVGSYQYQIKVRSGLVKSSQGQVRLGQLKVRPRSCQDRSVQGEIKDRSKSGQVRVR